MLSHVSLKNHKINDKWWDRDGKYADVEDIKGLCIPALCGTMYVAGYHTGQDGVDDDTKVPNWGAI